MRVITKQCIREIVNAGILKGQEDLTDWDSVGYFIITDDGEYIGIDKDDNKTDIRFAIVATRIHNDKKS